MASVNGAMIASKPIALRGYHLVAALHRPDRRLERTEASIFEGRAGRQGRLLADDAGTLDALDLAVGVGDDPFARDQLRRFVADVRDAHVVLEEVLALARRAALGHVGALDLDAYAARRSIAGAHTAGRGGRALPQIRRIGFFRVFGVAHRFLIMAWPLI